MDLVAAGIRHRGELLAGLDAFCHAAHVKLPGEACHRLDNGGTVRALGQIANKAAVDLDGVERKAAQVTERGEGRTKVVERDANTLLRSRWRVVSVLESSRKSTDSVISSSSRWGDKSGETEGCLDRFVEIRSAKLRRREIDGHPDFLGPGHASLQA